MEAGVYFDWQEALPCCPGPSAREGLSYLSVFRGLEETTFGRFAYLDEDVLELGEQRDEKLSEAN